MLYMRNKRIKTDYSRLSKRTSSREGVVGQVGRTPNYSSISHGKETILTRILNQINHEVDYETLSQGQIEEERERLRRKVKEMNGQISRAVQRQIIKRNEQQRVGRKAVVSQQIGLSNQQINREYISNTSKIHLMQDEFRQYNDKLMLLSDPHSKMNLIRRIAETELKAREVRQQLGRIKKNKFLREREIIKNNSKDSTQIQVLQLEYIQLAKKSQQLVSRSQEIQEEMADNQYKYLRQKDYYQQLKHQCSKLQQTDNPAMQQHLKILYKNSKKKLQTQMKRNQREDEMKKRKYYGLLVEFKQTRITVGDIELTIQVKERENQQKVERISKYIEVHRKMKEEDGEEEDYRIQPQNFMAAQLPKDKIFIRSRGVARVALTEKKRGRDKWYSEALMTPKQNGHQRRLNGSILRQASQSHKQLKSHSESGKTSGDQKYISHGHSILKQAGSIRHFRTEGTQVNSHTPLSLVTSQLEESYHSDFQG